MKKFATIALLLFATLSASAQFEQGLKYVGAYATGLDMSYSSKNKFRFGLGAELGYFIMDHLMLKADASYQHTDVSDDFTLGAGARYYVTHHGFYLGAGAQYAHRSPKSNDVLIPVEAGYSFYFNDYISFEPAVYYRMSVNDFSKGSTIGLKIGVGFYF